METKTAGRTRIWSTPDRKLNNAINKKTVRAEEKKSARLNALKTNPYVSDTAAAIGEVPPKDTKHTLSKQTKAMVGIEHPMKRTGTSEKRAIHRLNKAEKRPDGKRARQDALNTEPIVSNTTATLEVSPNDTKRTLFKQKKITRLHSAPKRRRFIHSLEKTAERTEERSPRQEALKADAIDLNTTVIEEVSVTASMNVQERRDASMLSSAI